MAGVKQGVLITTTDKIDNCYRVCSKSPKYVSVILFLLRSTPLLKPLQTQYVGMAMFQCRHKIMLNLWQIL